jgi:hypothetical protein
LPAGSCYIRVRGQNSSGVGPASNDVVIAMGVPGPPVNFQTSVSGRTVTLSWNAPTVGGAPTSYVLEVGTAPGATSVSYPTNSTATTYTAGNAMPGTAYLRVRARNASGTSLVSNEVSITVQ